MALGLLFRSNFGNWLKDHKFIQGLLPNFRNWLECYPLLIHGLLLSLIVSLPAVLAALLNNYVEKKALSAEAERYAAMKNLFERATGCSRDLMKSGKSDDETYKELRRLVEELGKEALTENGDWVLMHRERLLDIPR